MDFNMSDRQREWLDRVSSFMDKHVRPAVPVYREQDEAGERWKVIPGVAELKAKAKAGGLGSMFMPPPSRRAGECPGARSSHRERARPPRAAADCRRGPPGHPREPARPDR